MWRPNGETNVALYPKEVVEYVALTGVPRSMGSRIFVVDAVHGSDANSGDRWTKPLATVEAAWAKCTTLHNDVVLLVGNGTVNTQTAALTWNKSYTHLIGYCSPVIGSPRAVVACAAAMATTPFVTFSGSGCMVKNITFSHASTDALSLVNVTLTGGYNYFENVHFAGALGTNNSTGCRSLILSGATCISNTFKNCIIGDDTTAVVQGGADLAFLLAPSHNVFDDCIFRHQAGHTSVPHIVCALDHDMGRGNLFRRCLFCNSKTSVAQVEVWTNGEAFVEPARPLMLDCWMYGVGKWDNTNRGVITNITIAANTTGVNTGNTMIITSA